MSDTDRGAILGFDMVGLYTVPAGLPMLAAAAPGGRVWPVAAVEWRGH